MELRESWQTLQTRLAAARTLAESGDRAGALQEIDRALEVDPDFLAAHSLKERLAAIVDAPVPSEAPARALSEFEARARARRAVRRLAAAAEAIQRADFEAAAVAIDEARELGADAGALLPVERALDEAQLRRLGRRSFGPLIAAAATLMFGLLGASYLGERNNGDLQGHAVAVTDPIKTADVVTPPPVSTFGEISRVEPATEIVTLHPQEPEVEQPSEAPIKEATPPRVLSASLGSSDDDAQQSAALAAASPLTAPVVPAAAPMPPPSSSVVAPVAVPEPPPARVEPVAAATLKARVDPAPVAAVKPDSTVSPADITSPPAAPVRPADAEIRDVLQRYRTAFDQLNARSAHAIWPAVDERALAQAFNGLASQRLVFDACDVNLHGDAATAVCRGSAQYVPKVGSGDPQLELRTWKFTLRKAGEHWAIDTARAESARTER